MKNNKKKIDLSYYCCIVAIWVVIGVVIAYVIGSMVSYMSLNNWDIRCVFINCKPITVRESKK